MSLFQTHSESIGNVYTKRVGGAGLLVNCLISIVYMICIAAYWILYSVFRLVSCIEVFRRQRWPI